MAIGKSTLTSLATSSIETFVNEDYKASAYNTLTSLATTLTTTPSFNDTNDTVNYVDSFPDKKVVETLENIETTNCYEKLLHDYSLKHKK